MVIVCATAQVAHLLQRLFKVMNVPPWIVERICQAAHLCENFPRGSEVVHWKNQLAGDTAVRGLPDGAATCIQRIVGFPCFALLRTYANRPLFLCKILVKCRVHVRYMWVDLV